MTEDNTQALAGAASELNAELGFCCQFCGSDANERDELFKSEREINRLQSELSLLKRIISRVSDELNLPTENGNRVHDLQFWLDSPKPIYCTDAALIEQMNAAAMLAQGENGLEANRFARGFANRVLMHWGNKEGVHKALLIAFTNKT